MRSISAGPWRCHHAATSYHSAVEPKTGSTVSDLEAIVTTAWRIHLQGPALMDRMQRHAERFNTEIVFDTINRAELRQRPSAYLAITGNTTCDALIIATGASANTSACPPRRTFAGKGVSAWRHLRWFFLSRQTGRGSRWRQHRSREALYLANIASHVTLVLSPGQIESEKSFRIGYLRLNMPGKVRILGITWSRRSWATRPVSPEYGCTPCMAMPCLRSTSMASFIAVGHHQTRKLFEKQLEMRGGYIVVKEGSMARQRRPAFRACLPPAM